MTIETKYDRGMTVPVIIDGGLWKCKIRDIYVTFLYAMAAPAVAYSGDAWIDVPDQRGKLSRQTRAWSGNDEKIDAARRLMAEQAQPKLIEDEEPEE